MDKISDNEISTMLKLVAMGEVNLIPCNKLSAALQKIRSMQAENERLRVIEEKAIYTKDWLFALCEDCCHYVAETKICSEEGKIPCDALEVVKALEDALKGGS